MARGEAWPSSCDRIVLLFGAAMTAGELGVKVNRSFTGVRIIRPRGNFCQRHNLVGEGKLFRDFKANVVA